nr:alginate export family protein [Tahibacter caeni]
MAPHAAAADCGAATAHCLDLGGGDRVTFGASVRVRTMDYAPVRFGIGADDDAYTFYRGLFRADLRRGAHWQGFVELGAHDVGGRRGGAGATDRDGLDVQQAYLGWSDAATAIRIGRQEVSFGSSRLVSVRDGPNIRLAFDGLRASRFDGDKRVDLFALRPVRPEPGAFNDEGDRSQAFWGLHAALAPAGLAPSKIDAYGFGYRRDVARFAAGSGREYRQSFGARLYGRGGGWDWNTEAVYQRGRFGAGSIRAWTVASDTGYTFASLRGTPRLSLKADVASGDGDLRDGRLGTFNALYPNASYFSESSLLAPANLIDLQPALTLAPTGTLRLILGWDFVWKHRVADAVYTTPTPLVAVPGTAGTARRIGDQLKLESSWRFAPDWEARLQLAHFNAGPALREAGGRDVRFVSTALVYAW